MEKSPATEDSDEDGELIVTHTAGSRTVQLLQRYLLSRASVMMLMLPYRPESNLPTDIKMKLQLLVVSGTKELSTDQIDILNSFV